MCTLPLVVAATEAEIGPSIPLLKQLGIPYLITGVGMVATSYSLTRALARNRYSYVLNVGVAGSFDPGTALGGVVEVVEDTFSELGAEDNDSFLAIDTLGFGNASWACRPAEGITIGLPQVKGITVNTVHGCDHSIAAVRQRYPDVTTESMEGAAVFYVCAMENVPCHQVRSISNYVEIRNRERWEIPLAIEQLHMWLKGFVAS